MSENTHTIGIDLGTSNCALAVADEAALQVAPIAQITGQSRVTEESTLASALYIPYENQFSVDSLRLPWSEIEEPCITGAFAREIGAGNSERLVCSAKSWLCQTAIDAHLPILPWESQAVHKKYSPLEASTRLLEHLRRALHRKRHEYGLSDEVTDAQVVLTIPASFDEAARTFTAEAAVKAGWGENVALLEEPLAAFYAWLDNAGAGWRELVAPGELILICDVGG
ncbi:MAG: Hsp70 family protein, partial [Chitinivibrionales bacterium]|nr:Hsp70 family protein [Chitinivibrionales bacterium]